MIEIAKSKFITFMLYKYFVITSSLYVHSSPISYNSITVIVIIIFLNKHFGFEICLFTNGIIFNLSNSFSVFIFVG